MIDATAGATQHSALPADEAAGGLIFGRPIEDRGFEVVEAIAGAAIGLAVGAVVAGPLGAAIGGAIGSVAGLEAGEALERHEGRAAETTDASTD